MTAPQLPFADMPPSPRMAMVERWFRLTRDTMPAVADARGWPVRDDHCFQRILLDNACGGRWTDFVSRPAYARASLDTLARAVALGEACLAGDTDLALLDDHSRTWRRAADLRPASPAAVRSARSPRTGNGHRLPRG